MKERVRPSRRTVVGWIAGGAAAGVVAGVGASALAADDLAPTASRKGDGWRGLKPGIASYGLRKLPLDKALAGIVRVGLERVSIKSFHLPLESTTEERKAAAEQCRAAGVTPASCGVISMENDEAQIRSAFEYARDLGAPTIVCNPHPESMPLLDRMVKEFDIRLAIHNHGPADERWPTPYEAMDAAKAFDDRIGVCVDVGHTARAGKDPAKAIRDCAARLYDMHLKDVNRAAATGTDVVMGRGVLDIPGMLRALLEIKYAHHLGFEHELDPDDPIPGVAESVGYVRGVLSMI